MLSSADCRSFQSFGLFFNGFISIKEYEKPFNMDLFGGSRFIKNTLNEKLNEIKENRKVQSNDRHLCRHSNRVRNNHRPHSNHMHALTKSVAKHSTFCAIQTSSHDIPVVNLIDDSPSNPNTNTVQNKPQNHSASKPCVPSVVDTLESTMYQLSFASEPYKFDYQSKINMSLEAAKNDTKRLTFSLNPHKIREWEYKTEIERRHHVRDYMLLCLALINDLMAMDEAIDFVFAPNDCRTNPEFYSAFERIDEDKHGRNMCLEWIQNLLYSDAYETVDHFASDVRLIFKNVHTALGYEHEWSKNARVVEQLFEQELVCISRDIMNAEDVFGENGNPSQDPQQMECMEQNKGDIEACVERLKQQRQRAKQREKEEMNNGNIKGDNEHKSNAKLKEKADKKAERIKYLSNIERSKRKRAPKQKLKPRISIECEEGEIQQIKPLDECKLDETDVWFEFIGKYPSYAREIQRVIMICEGLPDEVQFGRYKTKLESIGSDLRLNLKNKSDTIQCKIYEILQDAKNKIMSHHPLSLSVLQDLMDKKTNQRARKKRVQRKNKVLDPYSKEAMQFKAQKEREKENELKKQKMDKECKQKMQIMDVDEDSEGSFDDNLYFDHDMVQDTHANGFHKIPKTTATKTIAKELPQNSGYLPIRPNNVDEFAVENVQNITEEDNTNWDRYKYTGEQQQDEDEVEIEF
eukprot:1093587_1